MHGFDRKDVHLDSAFLDVLEFEQAAGYELTKEPPAFPSARVIELRRKLIKEEYDETEAALQKIAATSNDDPSRDKLIAELADGLADLIWVCIGTSIHFGVDLPEVWDAVQESNMSKFGPGSSVRADGKRLKPPGWVPPDIVGLIASQQPLEKALGYSQALRPNGQKEAERGKLGFGSSDSR